MKKVTVFFFVIFCLSLITFPRYYIQAHNGNCVDSDDMYYSCNPPAGSYTGSYCDGKRIVQHQWFCDRKDSANGDYTIICKDHPMGNMDCSTNVYNICSDDKTYYYVKGVYGKCVETTNPKDSYNKTANCVGDIGKPVVPPSPAQTAPCTKRIACSSDHTQTVEIPQQCTIYSGYPQIGCADVPGAPGANPFTCPNIKQCGVAPEGDSTVETKKGLCYDNSIPSGPASCGGGAIINTEYCSAKDAGQCSSKQNGSNIKYSCVSGSCKSTPSILTCSGPAINCSADKFSWTVTAGSDCIKKTNIRGGTYSECIFGSAPNPASGTCDKKYQCTSATQSDGTGGILQTNQFLCITGTSTYTNPCIYQFWVDDLKCASSSGQKCSTDRTSIILSGGEKCNATNKSCDPQTDQTIAVCNDFCTESKFICGIKNESDGIHSVANERSFFCNAGEKQCVCDKFHANVTKQNDCGLQHKCNGQSCNTETGNPQESNTTHTCQTYGINKKTGLTVPMAPGANYDCKTENNVGNIDDCTEKMLPPPYCGSGGGQSGACAQGMPAVPCPGGGQQTCIAKDGQWQWSECSSHGIATKYQTYKCTETENQSYACTTGFPATGPFGQPYAKKAECVPGAIREQVTPCKPAGESTTTYCSSGVLCKLTVTNKGECQTTPTGPICSPDEIKNVCEGPCGNNPGDGNGGGGDNPPVNPPPCTQTCPDGSIIACDAKCNQPCQKICPNGSTVDCSANCPPCTKTCPNGTVVNCSATCPSCQTKTCSNGKKVCTNEDCPPCETKTCSDGSKICKDETCPPCTTKCSDGSTVVCGVQCPPCTKTCPDGSNVDCSASCPCKKTCPDGNVVDCSVNCPCVNKICANGLVVGCNDPCPNDSKTFCNDYQKCTAQGSGKQCSDDSVCAAASLGTCNQAYKCVTGGGGAECTKDGDCLLEKLKCVDNNGAFQCRPDSEGGENCETDSDCTGLDLFCDSTAEQCVPGGDSEIPCEDDTQCTYGCSDDGNLQCVFGGAGGLCNPYENGCSQEEYTCNADRQCVPDDCGGAPCNPANGDEDCTVDELPEMFCDTACQRCVPGGDTGVPCETDDQCQEINNPPEVSKTVAAPADYCTGIPATQLVGFTWEYSDVDDDRQSAYVFEISQSSAQNEDGSFAEPFITRSMLCDLNVFSGDPYCSVSNEQLVQVKLSASESQEQLDFETLYYWHVKVTDAKGQDSEWSETESFTYKDLSGASSHPAPSPFYSADKNAVAPGSTINFYNNSICYNDEGSTDCENYIWNFGDGPEETVDTKESQTHEYGIDKKKGSYATSLKACDEVGCCSATLDLPIKAAGPTDLPRWKEITPFLVP